VKHCSPASLPSQQRADSSREPSSVPRSKCHREQANSAAAAPSSSSPAPPAQPAPVAIPQPSAQPSAAADSFPVGTPESSVGSPESSSKQSTRCAECRKKVRNAIVTSIACCTSQNSVCVGCASLFSGEPRVVELVLYIDLGRLASSQVGLTGFKCKCGQLFCGSHRYAEAHRRVSEPRARPQRRKPTSGLRQHVCLQGHRAATVSPLTPSLTLLCACACCRSCSFDYKTAGKDRLSSQNPVVVASKVTKI
jgi:hypothetical protein